MRKGFALPLIVGLIFILITVGTIGYTVYFLQKNSKSSASPTTSGSPSSLTQAINKQQDQKDISVKGMVTDVSGGPEWVGETINFKSTKVSIETQNKKLLTVIIPSAKDQTRRCPNDNAPAIYVDIEVLGTETSKDTITCQFPNHFIKILPGTGAPKTIKSFINSKGLTKYILWEQKEPTLNNYTYVYTNNLYISPQEGNLSGAIKIVDVNASDFWKSPYISMNSGAKYLVTELLGPGDGQSFELCNENGKKIGIGLGTMGLGTKIPGMYGLRFGNWIGNTTNFTIKAASGNGHSYEATFDATTGKQIGETKQTG